MIVMGRMICHLKIMAIRPFWKPSRSLRPISMRLSSSNKNGIISNYFFDIIIVTSSALVVEPGSGLGYQQILLETVHSHISLYHVVF